MRPISFAIARGSIPRPVWSASMSRRVSASNCSLASFMSLSPWALILRPQGGQSAFGPEQPQGNFFVKRTIKHAALQTVVGVAPCPSFSFHAEFGGVSNPIQLKDGEYRVKVVLKVGKKTKTKIVRVKMDICSFTPNVIVAF